MTRVVSCYKTLVLLLAHKDSVTVTSITRTISKKSVINNSDEKPINDRFLRSRYVLTKTTGDQLSKRRKRRRQERKVVVMLEVSLKRLRDDSGWKDATFPFPPRLMICYQRRHLESALNQFISFVFNHPTGAFGQSTMENGTAKRGTKRNCKASPSIVKIFLLQRWCPSPLFPCILIKQSYGIPRGLSFRNYPPRLYSNYFRYSYSTHGVLCFFGNERIFKRRKTLIRVLDRYQNRTNFYAHPYFPGYN